MRRLTRFWQVLKQPAYRTRVLVFFLLGVVAILVARLFQPNLSSPWDEVLLEFAVSFGAVGVLQLLWDFLGGEPTELRIEEVKDEVRNITRSLTLLSDLVDGNIGIERIWQDRRAWEKDDRDGKEKWDTRIWQANQVDIISNTLWNNWMHREEFRKGLFDNVKRGACVRILIYDPDSPVLRQRAEEEKDTYFTVQNQKVYQMEQEIRSTLVKMAEEWNRMPAPDRTSLAENFRVRLATKTLLKFQMIRADDRIVVATYLLRKSGGPSPTMQLKADSAYFDKHVEQFKYLWDSAKPLSEPSDGDWSDRILEEYSHLTSPSAEDESTTDVSQAGT